MMKVTLEGFEPLPLKENDSSQKSTKGTRNSFCYNLLSDFSFLLKVFVLLVICMIAYSMLIRKDFRPIKPKLSVKFLNDSHIPKLKITRSPEMDSLTDMMYEFDVQLNQPANQTIDIHSVEVHSYNGNYQKMMKLLLGGFTFSTNSTTLQLIGRVTISPIDNPQCFNIEKKDGIINFTTQLYINIGMARVDRYGFSNKQNFSACCSKYCTPE